MSKFKQTWNRMVLYDYQKKLDLNDVAQENYIDWKNKLKDYVSLKNLTL